MEKWFEKNKHLIMTGLFLTSAIILGLNGVSGYGWLIFGAFVTADIL